LLAFCSAAVKVRPTNWAKALETGVALDNQTMLQKALKIATTHDDCKDDASAGIGGVLLEVMKTQRRQEKQMADMTVLLEKKLTVIEELLRNK